MPEPASEPTTDTVSTALVLGSGGARGLAHIGVIRCLEAHGYSIDYVAGSSIGALVGGIHAAGSLDDYADWVGALQRSDVLRLLDWTFGAGALLRGERVIAVLRELIGDVAIETLPIGYTAVATDVSRLGNGREIWLNRGSLFDAIRASISVPGVFVPVNAGERLLVDGGIVNPVPVAPTLNADTRVTIAVDLNGRADPTLDDGLHTSATDASRHDALQDYRLRIGRYLDGVWPSPPKADTETVGMTDVLMRSLEAAQATITDFRFAATRPTIVIRIPRNLCGFFDFHRADDLIDYGHARAERALAEPYITNRVSG